ncbi:MAG: Murein DD-endopeptidase MepM [Candidatus Hydrogenedentes bacterium ADurb.Bin101]|nr:MAG: Murein DD-endopeptidase MepM [Candidatus Hydrogenedentes bacterium ADurb.Bin101]HOC69437.1 M23 family metallopeptidase [Candidatus Hydrogenedentota bacterium]HOH32022.1 M23 family metallopeptidase [Candidatus Hydrogenedentota bacterium]
MNRGSLTRKLCLGVLVCIVAFLLNPGCAHNRDVVRLEPIMPPPEPAIIVEETSEATPLREGYIVPVEHPDLRISSDYGARRGNRRHKGIDLDVPEGVPVVAARDGIARFSGWDGAYGKIIILGHEEGYETAYAHLCECCVGENEKVEQGQVIGRVGCTGNATGSHLHFELRHNGEPIDPNAFLSVAAR